MSESTQRSVWHCVKSITIDFFRLSIYSLKLVWVTLFGWFNYGHKPSQEFAKKMLIFLWFCVYEKFKFLDMVACWCAASMPTSIIRDIHRTSWMDCYFMLTSTVSWNLCSDLMDRRGKGINRILVTSGLILKHKTKS